VGHDRHHLVAAADGRFGGATGPLLPTSEAGDRQDGGDREERKRDVAEVLVHDQPGRLTSAFVGLLGEQRLEMLGRLLGGLEAVLERGKGGAIHLQIDLGARDGAVVPFADPLVEDGRGLGRLRIDPASNADSCAPNSSVRVRASHTRSRSCTSCEITYARYAETSTARLACLILARRRAGSMVPSISERSWSGTRRSRVGTKAA
jgi:hypothetical protein